MTIPDETFQKGLVNAKKRGFSNSFSAYIAWLIERDSEGEVQREDLIVDKPSPYKYTPLKVAEEPPAPAGRRAKRKPAPGRDRDPKAPE